MDPEWRDFNSAGTLTLLKSLAWLSILRNFNDETTSETPIYTMSAFRRLSQCGIALCFNWRLHSSRARRLEPFIARCIILVKSFDFAFS
jgi:hypothetical protein